ncbi:pyridoxamine 5'-phosphate oxidase family protein [Fodinicola acaciae]|uniref:pyridoxamine 5'-phosphate oxidase family protein n=1 Tax=Fodinicola acaciae TaxID=2681555 RepID=UPI0013D17C32|nr:pyridoxamine 5'-phosphate oxidase family protein [Fodinicola acaciae]
MHDSNGLELLDHDQCLDLLATQPVGRIVYTLRAMPAVLPVTFAVHNGGIVIKTNASSRLAKATRGAIVAFEVDEYDQAVERGWSVVIIGPSEEVTKPAELAAIRSLPLKPWTTYQRQTFISIRPHVVTGRRLRQATTSGSNGRTQSAC